MHGLSHSLPTRNILPHEYHQSEKLPLEFWDPRRLAAHVVATLPKDQRAAAVDLILDRQITGAFLVRYTHEIEHLLSDEEGAIVRAIAQTVSSLYWIPWREPHAYDRYNLHEIVKDLWDHSRSSTVAPATAPWVEMRVAGDEKLEVGEAATLEDIPLPEPLVEAGAGKIGEQADSEDHQADEDGRANQQGGEGAAADPESLWESIWLAMCPDTRSMFSEWRPPFVLDSQEDGETETEQSRPGNAATSGSATLLLRDAESQIRRWCFRA